MNTVLYIFIALVVGYALGSARRRFTSFRYSAQNDGESRLSRLTQEHFHAPDYHLLNHITLKIDDGTTQIDHIWVSKFGVFVIETKDYQGWIFANANHERWTQVLFKFKYQFQNPIVQNRRHVDAVQKLLDFLPPSDVKSVVVFTGNAEFKTPVPRGVFSLEGYVDYIRDRKDEVMSVNRVQFCVGRLETARLAITRETDIEHVQNLARWHDDAR